MKIRRRLMAALLILLICGVTMVQPAIAAEPPAVTIPVTISLSGTLPSTAEDFVIMLKADDASYPMPAGAENGTYSMTINGAASRSFPAITYDRVGVYTYTIWQAAGTNPKCTYDDTVYELTVSVTNAEDGSGLEITAVLYPDAQGSKQPVAAFQNQYEVVSTPNTPSTPPTDTPQTNDLSHFPRYLVLAIVSAAVLVGLVLTRKNKKTEE